MLTFLLSWGLCDPPQPVDVVSEPAAGRGRSYIPPADSAAPVLSAGPEASPAPSHVEHKSMKTGCLYHTTVPAHTLTLSSQASL